MIPKPELNQLPLCGDNFFGHRGFFREAELGISFYTVYLANELINELIETDDVRLCVAFVWDRWGTQQEVATRPLLLQCQMHAAFQVRFLDTNCSPQVKAICFKQLTCKSNVLPRISRLILDEDRVGVHPSLDRDSLELMRFWFPLAFTF